MVMAQQETALETRLLLWLWFAAQQGKTVTQAQVVSKLKRKDESAEAYRQILRALDSAGAIAIQQKQCSITPAGEAHLAKGLADATFELSGTIVGTWVANALLLWLRQTPRGEASPPQKSATRNGAAKTKAAAQAALTSYEAFQKAALETYDSLNRSYNLDDLVPIYRIRRELGDRVTRANFDAWLLEMQSQDMVQLIGGEMPELTADKAEDSVQTRMGTTRYYVKRLDP